VKEQLAYTQKNKSKHLKRETFLFLAWSGTESTITKATNGLLYHPRMMDDEQSVECLAGETEVLEENLSQCCFVLHKSHMT
jgi:hypothetical protein